MTTFIASEAALMMKTKMKTKRFKYTVDAHLFVTFFSRKSFKRDLLLNHKNLHNKCLYLAYF